MIRTAASDKQIYEIDMRNIRLSQDNVRHSQQDKELDELMASIKEHGLLHPVVLRGTPKDSPPYELIVGQRRWLAHKRLEKKIILARFAGELDHTQAIIRSLAENLHRVKLNLADTMTAVTELYIKFDREERRVREKTGLSLQKIRQYVYIQERASKGTKEKIRRKEVTVPDVQRALRAASGDIEKADALLETMQKYNLSKPQKDRLVEYGEAHPRASKDKIWKEATTPRIEESILVRLPERVRQALERAANKLAMEPEQTATFALNEWLSQNGYLNE